MFGLELKENILTCDFNFSFCSGNVVGQFPKADLIALRNSVICADKITNVNIDGDIDLSVSVKPANACAGKIMSASYW